MTLWFAWTILVSTLLAAAAVAAERITAAHGAARRFVWITALLASVAIPVAVAARPSARLASAAPWIWRRSVVRGELVLVTVPSRVSGQRSIIDWITLRSGPRSIVRSRTLRRVTRMTDRWALGVWAFASLGGAVFLGLAAVRLRNLQARWTEIDTEVGP